MDGNLFFVIQTGVLAQVVTLPEEISL